ncbi:MAG: methyl-accepting chemotaxis protein [Candidatus Neomarinimicrobiota bacterium]
MKMFQNLSVQKKLFVSLLPPLALVIVIATVLLYNSQAKETTATQNDGLVRILEKTETELQIWVDEKFNDAVRFSKLPVFVDACLGNRREEAQTALTNMLAVSKEYENLFLADKTGKIFLLGAGNAAALNIDISQIPVYQENARKATRGERYIGNAGVSPVSGRPVALMTVPIFSNGEVVGIIGTPVELMEFSSQYISNFSLGESGYMYMMDYQGIVLAYPDETQIMKLDLSKYSFGPKMLEMKNGYFNYDWQGKDVVVHFRTNASTNWMIAIRQNTEEFMTAVKKMAVSLAIMGVVLILIAALVVWLSARLIVTTLVKVVDMLKDIAQGEGDLTRRLDLDSKDELGQLARWFNIFVDKLHSVISQVKISSEQVTTASQEISASSEELASGAEEQQSQTSEVATSVEEMAATILQSSNNTNTASASAKKAANVATNGGGIVQQTIAGMQRISDAVRSSAQRIEELGRQSEEIGQIIKVIDDIADQTNLLALNANIEAARAGEQGRGFAVVADEVRVLAERTTKATAEIAEMIKGIQGSTGTAVSAMDDGIKEVNSGVELAGKAGSALEEIIAVVNEVDNVISQVAAAAEQQSAGAEEISANVEGISTVTKQSATSAQQMASAAQQLSEESEALNALIKQFKL